jgi:hypothetical protein
MLDSHAEGMAEGPGFAGIGPKAAPSCRDAGASLDPAHYNDWKR